MDIIFKSLSVVFMAVVCLTMAVTIGPFYVIGEILNRNSK